MKRLAFFFLMGFVISAGCSSGKSRPSGAEPDGGETDLPDGQVPDAVAPAPDAGAGMDAAPPPGRDAGTPDGAEPDGPDANTELTCTSDKDCTEHGLLCDVMTELCVECVYDVDCGADARCVDSECAAITPCEDSLDCSDDPLERTICDKDRGECVECLAPEDCPENHDCEGNRCRAFAPCVNSLDCPPGMVCDTALGRCLQCVRNEDCPEGQVCVAAVCRLGCDSDNDCTPYGLLCNLTEGYCAECLVHEDCAEPLFCSLGNCVLDVCRAGTDACQNNTVVTCVEEGYGYTLSEICGLAQTCVESPPTAACEDWVCSDPGNRTCSDDHSLLIDCAADGLSFETVENCERNDELCVVDECLPVVCIPSELSCDGDDRVLLCNADGTSETETDDCQSDEYCDQSDPACLPQICPPDEWTCEDDTVARCNSRGSDYSEYGDACTDTGEGCVGGECKALTEEEFGVYDTTSTVSNSLRGAIYNITTARTLAEIEAFLSISTTGQTLTFVVYEGATQTGTYSKIFEKAVTTTTTGQGYYSSGRIGVPLSAGNFYAVVTHWTASVSSYYDSAALVPFTLSFGDVVAGYSLTATVPPASITGSTSTSVFPQRIKTAEP